MCIRDSIPGGAGAVVSTRNRIEEIAAEEDLAVLGWREVPVDPSSLGKTALECMPTFVQLFVSAPGSALSGMDLERAAFCLRKRAERETDVYFASLSSRTIAYKGMLTTEQLDQVFPDLNDERVESAIGVVHSRFSTNTFPSWPLSHPFRFIAHNGEINTVMGNRNWMRAREALLESDLIPGDLERLYPICTPGASDSASFDEVLELLHLGGRILNLASDVAFYGPPRLVHYVASKGGIVAMTRAMARDAGPDGITVNALAPGITECEATDNVPAERHELYRSNRALSRSQRPEDLVGSARFLLSDAADYVTGQTLLVNGGFVCR